MVKKYKQRTEYYRQYALTHRDQLNAKLRRFSQTPKGFYKTLKGRKNKLKITQADFLKWYTEQPQECFYCNITPDKLIDKFSKVSGRETKRLTIDRLDSNLPYQLGNLVLACYRCNITKSDFFTPEEMKLIATMF